MKGNTHLFDGRKEGADNRRVLLIMHDESGRGNRRGRPAVNADPQTHTRVNHFSPTHVRPNASQVASGCRRIPLSKRYFFSLTSIPRTTVELS